MIRAQAQADENKILTESLTPEFLRWHNMEVMENISKGLATSPNNTVYLMPYEAMGPASRDNIMLRDAMEGK